MFVGKCVHAGLELWYRHRLLNIPIQKQDVIAQCDQIWNMAVTNEVILFKDVAEEGRLKQQTVNLVRVYLENVPDDEPPPLAVESRWQMPLVGPATGEDLGVPLLGIIDLVLDDPEGALIVDFKTAANASVPVAISHEIQLTSYAYLLRTATDRTEGELQIRSLVKTKTPSVVTHRFPPREGRHFRRLFSVIREYLDALDRGQFNFRPGWTCGSCDYREGPCSTWRG
jgi:hypothetical protein